MTPQDTTVQDARSTFGRPITGDITPGEAGLPPQAPDEEFFVALDALLAHPEVVAVKWDQYTPYFNDGDACVFGTGESYVKLTWTTDEDGEMEDGFVSSYELYDYGPPQDGQSRYTNKVYQLNGHDTTEIAQLLNDFASRSVGRTHYVFLQKTFGDHASVTATREGFNVEFYEHD